MDSRERVSNTSNAAGAGAIQLLPHLSSSRVGASGGGGHHNLVTTQADVEHHQQQHHQPQQHPQLQQQRPDMRSPQPMAEPFPVFDTNQVRKIRDINIQRNLQMKLNAVQPIYYVTLLTCNNLGNFHQKITIFVWKSQNVAFDCQDFLNLLS